MAVNVTVDQIADALVTRLGTLVPDVGDPLSADKPVRTVQRYTGDEISTQEALRRGVAGRCPAVRVRYVGSRTLRTTMGRRVDKVESTFAVLCFSDSVKSRDDRKALFSTLELVRRTVGSRRFALALNPMRWQRNDVVRDDAALLAYAAVFTTRHRVDYTIDPGEDEILTVAGDIVNGENTLSAIMHAPTVAVQGTAGVTSWGYKLVGVDEDGLRTLLSDEGTTASGAATLNGSNFIRLTWAAVDGVETYEIHRTTASGTPATLGKIGTTDLLTFDDTGLAPSADTAPDKAHLDMELDYT